MPFGPTPVHFMDGKTAREQAARASIAESELVVMREDGEVLARWPLSALEADPVHEGSVVHVECALSPLALVTITDPAFIDALRRRGARVGGVPVGRRAVVVGAVSLALFGAVMGGFYMAAPWLSSRIAAKVPVETERRLSASASAWVVKRACTGEGAAEALDRLVTRLDPDRTIGADVHIVAMPIANAFALPGGTVLVTSGLLESAEGEEEIEGVLAHELSHVKHRHALAHTIRGALLGGLWAVTLGDYSGLMVIDPKTAYETATLRYTREAETEADQGALETLTLRRIPAQGLVNFLQRTSSEESGSLSFLSTHPASSDRIRALSAQKLAEKAPPVLGRDDMYRLRRACDSMMSTTSLRDLFF